MSSCKSKESPQNTAVRGCPTKSPALNLVHVSHQRHSSGVQRLLYVIYEHSYTAAPKGYNYTPGTTQGAVPDTALILGSELPLIHITNEHMWRLRYSGSSRNVDGG